MQRYAFFSKEIKTNGINLPKNPVLADIFTFSLVYKEKNT